MILQISSAKLGLGMRGDDVARVQQALQTLGRIVPPTEKGVLGAGTVAVLKTLQEEHGLPASGVVDAATVKAINVELDKLATDPRVVRGSVRDANGNPVSNGFVQIFSNGLDGEQAIGRAELQVSDGTYEISYQPPSDNNGRVDLRVAVANNTGPVETTPSGASILTNAGPLEVVNFVLSGKANQPSSEFELIMEDLKPLLGGRSLADLTEDEDHHDVSIMAIRSGHPSEHVAAVVVAHKLEKDTGTPAPVFYGLLRQGMPADVTALYGANPKARLRAVQLSAEQGLVPKEIDGKKIEDHLTDFAPAPARELQGLLGRILNANRLKTFVDLYLKDSENPEAFWNRLAANPAWADSAEELKRTVQFAALTNNHVPLVDALKALPNIRQIADVARLTETKWQSLIQAQGVGVPDDTPGANADEKAKNYVQQIIEQVEVAFPTRFIAERLGNASVAKFLKSQTSFNLTTTYPEQFFKKNPAAAAELTPQDRDDLRTLQRLYRLTSSATETIALAKKGVRSAHQITRIDRTVFIEQTHEILSPDRARQVHERALRTNAIALALAGEHAAGLNRTGLHSLPKLDTEKQKAEAENGDAESGIPDWETLFGTFDFCACEDCGSAHSPAAYLVDILMFLDQRAAGERSVKDALFARRPDLGDIELSCENTNTVLPLIDLVNEVLENAVAPPPPFVPLTLQPALADDLGQPLATETLASAFNPPLLKVAQVETLEAGKRWRIWDEPFAYSVVKEANDLKVVARSRQTIGSAEERRATPQYRNGAAYAELKRAVYPWTLPFDLSTQEANVFLTHLGVSRRGLIEALRPAPDSFDPNSPMIVLLAAERLGLNETERKIIVGEPLVPSRQPNDFWGDANVATLKTVRELLDRSGLTYAELEALLATWFINPAGTLAISAKPDAPVATCDTTNLQISRLTADVLSRIHRFVRLWRKLGWTIPEVDKAIRAFAPDGDTPSVTNQVLVRFDILRALRSELRLTVAQALAFWRPIDTEEPGSLYRSLFFNPAVFKPQEEDFRLRSGGQELVHSDKMLADHAAALQAVFRLNAESIAQLNARTDGKLTLANLSLLYRHATMARQLRLPVQDVLTAIDLTGINPFVADRTEDTLRFIDVVRDVLSSGFRFAELDYIIRHRFNPASASVPTEFSLSETLTEIRRGLIEVNAQSGTGESNRQESAVIDRVSAALKLPADLTAALLGKVSHGADTAMQQFLGLHRIADTALPLSRVNSQASFETLEKLLKIAKIIQTLDLPGSQLEWLFRENPWLAAAPDPPAMPVAFASWFTLIQLRLLRRDLSLDDAALEAILGGASAIAVAVDEPARLAAKEVFLHTLSTWLGWLREDLDALLGKGDNLNDQGLLNVRLPDDYRGLKLLFQLQRSMVMLQRLGARGAEASEWCEPSLSDANAKAIRQAAKAKYDDDTWLKLSTPLQDALRDKQREALVAYLAARPAEWTTGLIDADADDLYAHFLIDVEMTSCQLTSRIKQALGSVQLFAQRCLMGLEPDVRTSDGKWRQWEWMKNFRVWEANRKIWLYPENWIEPELRDDKSPFFKDLENELLQGDLDNTAAEQAVFHYLEKLDEVSRVEIVGMFEDDEDRTLHVFGRTVHTPHIYYYRRRVGTTQAWTPWEKVELDIEGDHLIPVMLNGKLMLIWVLFTEKEVKKQVEIPEPGGTLDSADPYWEIQLAWSEYQNGGWSGKILSEPVTLTAYQGRNDIHFGDVPGLPDHIIIVTDHTVHPPRSYVVPRRLVSKEQISFKALVVGESLLVQGFLRRDYAEYPPSESGGPDSQIACLFGILQFFGCRKALTTTQVTSANFPLAPTGTKFDHMWLTQRRATPSSLILADGNGRLPVISAEVSQIPPAVVVANEAVTIAGDPSSLVANKLDIPVLDVTPTAFRLMVPHQDWQFVGDRPFVFMDTKATFLVTSSRSSLPGPRPDVINWVNADLATAWRSDYFKSAVTGGLLSSTVRSSGAMQPLTVLTPGSDGQRIARRMSPVNLEPVFNHTTLLPTFRTSRQYTFANFSHPYLCEFSKTLDRRGIAALLSLETQSVTDTQSFEAYRPTVRVLLEHPVDEVEFQSGRSYEQYNWELFFHIPLLIAERLKANQRFEDAQRWFHFIFDPTGASGGEVPQRYWRTKPFFDRLKSGYEAESVKTIEEMIAKGISDELKVAVEIWRSNPFSPHAVARLRTTAYQKTVVMKYIDNLIFWGDQLFQRDTLESINEATQLYILAAEILGRRPEVIERDLKPAVQTFNTLDPEAGGFGNTLEQIELLIPDAGGGITTGNSSQAPDPPSSTVLYFCVPENDKLLGYWATVSDRLFKIRHCMNIEGQVRQLPLFEPPIDPALLVRARAAGLSIGAVLSDIAVSLPNYRFSVMAQKANELVAEVRNLGAGLLAALEKRDSEALSLLRSGQEVRLLEAVRDIRIKQIDEAKKNTRGLQSSRQMAEARRTYYDSREFLNSGEQAAFSLSKASLGSMVASAALRTLAGVLEKGGVFKLGSGFTTGLEEGPAFIGYGMLGAASGLDVAANILNVSSQLTGRMGDYGRRQDEWDLQAELATIELEQIDQQLVASEIRLAVAEQELRNHDRQIENAHDVDRHLHDKFTNQDLYQWMIGQVSGLYFQSYQLAYDLAKRSELCMQHELGLKYGETSFIRFGYWDSLKKGLMAGDHLAHDLKRLEIAYLERNVREYELTKHFSLVSLAPEQFLALKETGACEFEIPEWLFDLDTPGHYRRRLKMVSVTIPSVTGPYTSVHSTLRLLKSSFRHSTTLDSGYERRPTDETSASDDRFIDNRSVLETIVTSTGQNDAGIFEPGMRDERYLPFEGAGAISTWRFELPVEFKTFDYGTISDVILHMRYSARDGGTQLSSAATTAATNLLRGGGGGDPQPLLRLFSLRHEFPSEWHRFVSSPASAVNTMTVNLAATRFPYLVQNREIVVKQGTVIGRTKGSTAVSVAVAPGEMAPDLSESTWTGESNPGPWTFGTDADPKLVEDVFLIFAYSAS